ncbi:hypothetical protein IR083_07280 [Dysgonomonas sp. GY75]|uniref:hypothetical protein n=1 Tax=Dysgonomonas sp. GY75 TaxID=2780419 RepID=UPI0018833532|nr:hypothetical protein [Dysgonomonas sp. GY75]MBF0648617.1 hypothetical protein [Dysgonomonas sp. GY75]
MPRQDIYTDAIYGECNLTDNLTTKVISPFVFLDSVEGMDNDTYCYGEVTIPKDYAGRMEAGKSIYTRIEYTPVYKELFIRLKLDIPDIIPEYVINKSDNTVWFPIKTETDDGEVLPARTAGLLQLNDKGYYNLQYMGDYIAIYSAYETDFEIKASLKQNEVFLLKTFAGNLYQHPVTGVGLIEFLHGNLENSGLAGKLQQEFGDDKMIINNAYMDSSTGELYMEITEKNG